MNDLFTEYCTVSLFLMWEHSLNRCVSGLVVTRNFQSCLYQYYLRQNAEMKESGLFTKKGLGMGKEISRERPFLRCLSPCL